jgi:integrase
MKKITNLHGKPSAKAVRGKTVPAKDTMIVKLRGDRERIYLTGGNTPPGLFARTSMTKPPAIAGLIYLKDPETLQTIKKKEVTLGQSTMITVSDAIVRLRKMQAAADLGQGNAVKSQITTSKTVEDLLAEYVKARLIRTAQDKAEVIKRLLDGLLDQPVSVITRSDVEAGLKELVRAGKRRSHNLSLTAIRSWREWVLEGYSYDLPDWTAGMKNVKVVTAERKILSRDELKVIWVKAADLHPAYRTLVRTLMLTGLRLNEAAKLTRAELNGDIVIPGVRMKNGLEHMVPISAPLRKELDTWLGETTFGSGEFIFSTTDGRVPVSGWTNAKLKLEAHNWSFHGLRHSMATNMAEFLKIDEDLIERILAHRRVGISNVYNKATRIEERRQALESWAQWIAI